MKDKIDMGGSAVPNGVMLKSENYKVTVTHTDEGFQVEQVKEKVSRITKIMSKIPLIRGVISPFLMMWDKLKSLKAKVIYSLFILGVLGIAIYTATQGWQTEGLTWINFIVPCILLGLIGLSILGSLRMKPLQDLFRYHGAEHMAVNAWENDIPLTTDIKDVSTFHPRCGSNMVALTAILSIIIMVGLYKWIPVFWGVWILQVLAVEIFILGSKYKSIGNITNMAGKMFQKYTVLRPKEKHLQTGLAAALTLIKLEESKAEIEATTTIYKDYEDFLAQTNIGSFTIQETEQK